MLFGTKFLNSSVIQALHPCILGNRLPVLRLKSKIRFPRTDDFAHAKGELKV